MDDKPSFADQVKALLDEYDVERRLGEIADQADQLVRQGLAVAGEFAHEHRADVGRWFDMAADAVNGRTDGRHASTLEEVRGVLDRGVERIAEQRPDSSDGVSTGSADDLDASGPTDVADESGER